MPAAPPFLWVGNHPATDLCNTRPVVAGQRVELLDDLDDVLAWAHAAGVGSAGVGSAGVGSAGTAAAGTAAAATSAHGRETVSFVRRLRDDGLRPLLESGRRDVAALRALNAVLAEQPGVLTVLPAAAPATAAQRAGAGARRATSPGAAGPVTLAGPTPDAQLRLDVAAAVLDVFRYDPRLVRRCANPACVLLFLDVSKSGRRRWCDMATCGNRAKAAAHYARSKTT